MSGGITATRISAIALILMLVFFLIVVASMVYDHIFPLSDWFSLSPAEWIARAFLAVSVWGLFVAIKHANRSRRNGSKKRLIRSAKWAAVSVFFFAATSVVLVDQGSEYQPSHLHYKAEPCEIRPLRSCLGLGMR